MTINTKITPSEEEIMELLWKEARWMTIREMMDHLEKNGKYWKRQTLNTFLVHLIEKGLVIKNGRKYIYAYSKKQFQTDFACYMLDDWYEGSVKNFVSALSGSSKLTQEDASELKRYLEELSAQQEE